MGVEILNGSAVVSIDDSEWPRKVAELMSGSAQRVVGAFSPKVGHVDSAADAVDEEWQVL
jgi:hypothetical protein